MQFQYRSSRKGAVWLLGSLAFTACNASTSAPAPAASSVDSAYAELVAEFANCAKQVKSCVDGAADSSAVSACRDEFASCRDAAGEHAISEVADAVRGCTQQQNACVKAARGSAAGSCHDALVMCLGAAHPVKGHDDDDGGVDERGSNGKGNGDCLQNLHACVEADGPANACAEDLRSCVSEAMPNAGEVVPEEDSAEAADESSSPADGHGRDAGANNAHDNPADMGAKGQAARSAARQCTDSFATCVDAGSSARSCVMALKQCHAAAK
jgi:hypothetical protein